MKKLPSFKNIRVDDCFCNFLDKRFSLKLEQIFIFQRSHNGIQFTNRTVDKYAWMHIFDCICYEYNIEHRLTKVNHPWTNGQVERMNRTIKEATDSPIERPKKNKNSIIQERRKGIH